MRNGLYCTGDKVCHDRVDGHAFAGDQNTGLPGRPKCRLHVQRVSISFSIARAVYILPHEQSVPTGRSRLPDAFLSVRDGGRIRWGDAHQRFCACAAWPFSASSGTSASLLCSPAARSRPATSASLRTLVQAPEITCHRDWRRLRPSVLAPASDSLRQSSYPLVRRPPCTPSCGIGRRSLRDASREYRWRSSQLAGPQRRPKKADMVSQFSSRTPMRTAITGSFSQTISSTLSGGRPNAALSPLITIGRSIRMGLPTMAVIRAVSDRLSSPSSSCL